MKNTKKLPTVINLTLAAAPRYGVRIYGTVQSRSRGTRLNHGVIFRQRGRRKKWSCTCEHNHFRGIVCDHIKAMKLKLTKKAEGASDTAARARKFARIAA